MSAEGGQCCRDSVSYVLLIGSVGDRGTGWRDFNGHRGADEVVDGRYGGSEKDDREVGVGEGESDLVREAETYRKGGGLRSLPGECARGRYGSVKCFERRGCDVNAGAGGGCVEKNAG
jgi:hypothetical protein